MLEKTELNQEFIEYLADIDTENKRFEGERKRHSDKISDLYRRFWKKLYFKSEDSYVGKK